VWRTDAVTDLASAVSAKGSFTALAIAAVMLLLGAMVRRLDRGSEQTMEDLRDLNERLERERDRAVAALESARLECTEHRAASDKVLTRMRRERDQARQYVRDLEYRLGEPHREWP
jgi:uncharacterized membrane protein YhiD involved in acid resistance